MKVHLGCGRKFWPGWWNVDGSPASVADEVCNLLDYEPRAPVDSCAAIHVLEHLAEDDCRKLVERVHGWLVPGGQFIVEMPDRDKCLLAAQTAHPPTSGPYLWDHPAIQGLGGLLGDRPAVHEAWVVWLAGNSSTVVSGVLRGDYESFLPQEFNSRFENHRCVWSEHDFSDVMRAAGFRVSAETPQYHGKRSHRDMRLVGIKGTVG